MESIQQTLIYEVEIEIKPDTYLDYLKWLKDEHIPEVLSCPGFLRAITLESRNLSEAQSWTQLRVLYWVTSQQDLDNYFKEHAPLLRQKAMDRFTDRFRAKRQIWKVLNEL